MSKALTYKGYTARVEFDAEDRVFFGRLAGLTDIVTFHGESVDELVHAFEEAVDAYLAMSKQLGRAPQAPYSGKITVRIPPDVHARAALLAEREGKSLSRWAQDLLQRSVEGSPATTA